MRPASLVPHGPKRTVDNHWVRILSLVLMNMLRSIYLKVSDSADFFKISFTLISSLTCYFSISGHIFCEHGNVLLTLTF